MMEEKLDKLEKDEIQELCRLCELDDTGPEQHLKASILECYYAFSDIDVEGHLEDILEQKQKKLEAEAYRRISEANRRISEANRRRIQHLELELANLRAKAEASPSPELFGTPSEEVVQGLRDTGATTAALSPSLAGEADFTGEEACFRQALKVEPLFLPFVKVKLRGKLIGNLATRQTTIKLQQQIAKQIDDKENNAKGGETVIPNPEQLISREESGNKVLDLEGEETGEPSEKEIPSVDLGLAVPINSIDQNKGSITTLDVCVFPEINKSVLDKLKVSREEFIKLQLNDGMPKKEIDFADSGIKGKESHFEVKDGVLTPFLGDNKRLDSDQLVLPTQLRSALLEVTHFDSFGAHVGMTATKETESEQGSKAKQALAECGYFASAFLVGIALYSDTRDHGKTTLELKWEGPWFI